MIVSNYYGNGLDRGRLKSQLDLTTLGNQDAFEIKTISFSNITVFQGKDQDYVDKNLLPQISGRFNAWANNQNKNLYMVIIPDAVLSLIFFCFCIAIRVKSSKRVELAKREVNTVSNYSLEVYNFPSTVTKPDELKAFFEKNFDCQVVEVCLARNYYGTLLMNRDESAIQKRIFSEQFKKTIDPKYNSKKIEQLEKKKLELQKKTEKVRSKYLQNVNCHNDYPSLSAFVIFNDRKVRNEVYKQYRQIWSFRFRRTFFGCCCWNDKDEYDAKYFFQDQYLLKVKEADVPGNILWENKDATQRELFLKRVFSLLSVALVMAFSFVIIVAANNYQNSVNYQNCDQSQIYTYLTQYQTYGTSKDTDTVNYVCYCQLTKNGAWYSIYNKESDFCYEWAKGTGLNEILTILSSIVISLSNTFLKQVMLALGKFERYVSKTQQTYSSMSKLAAVLFINTALLAMLLQSQFDVLTPGTTIKTTEVVTFFLPSDVKTQIGIKTKSDAGYFFQISREWYLSVGSKILTSLLIAVVLPHAVPLLRLPFDQLLFYCQKKKTQTQRELNDKILGPKFDLTVQYAFLISILFSCLFHSGGMPLAIIFCLGSLFLQYWIAKYMLLRWYQKPDHYDETIDLNVVKSLPIALILHCAFAVYQFGDYQTFPNAAYDISQQVGQNGNWDYYRLVINNYDKDSTETVQKSTTAIFSLVFNQDTVVISRLFKIFYITLICLAGVLLFVLDNFIVSKIIDITNNNKIQVANTQTIRMFGNFEEEREILSHSQLTTYDIYQNKDYYDLVAALDKIDVNMLSEDSVDENKDQIQNLNQTQTQNQSKFKIQVQQSQN